MTLQQAIVVGGGLVGCFSAWNLRRLGWEVTLIERDRIGSGASYGNCGYICPSHVFPLFGPGVIRETLPQLLKRDGALSISARWNPALWHWLWGFRGYCTQERMMRSARGRSALLRASDEMYSELFDAGLLEAERQRLGLLTVYRSASAFDAFGATAAMLRSEFDLETSAYVGAELNDLEPSLRSGLAGGWLYESDSHIRPDRLLDSLRLLLENDGVEISEGITLESFRSEAGRVRGIETSAGSRDADAVILANGAEAARWAKALGCRVPIQPGKGYSITMPPLSHQPVRPMIFEEHHVAVTPFESAIRIGSTMEFAGFDRSLNPKRVDLLRRSAREHLVDPIPDEQGEVWCGWRPMSLDGLPSIGPVPAAANLFLAAGNGMIGLASAPSTGRLAAELASGEQPHIDPAPYAAARFG